MTLMLPLLLLLLLLLLLDEEKARDLAMPRRSGCTFPFMKYYIGRTYYEVDVFVVQAERPVSLQ